MVKEKLVTLDYLKKYDTLKTPPIQYVTSLPTEKVENGIYAVTHSDIEIKTVDKTFHDLLTSYFKETVKGKWTTDYKVTVEDNVFMSAAVIGETVSIYKNPDWSSLYPDTYDTETVYTFTVKEESTHIDYFAGNANGNTFTKLANVDEVERYFIRNEQKGAANGVASLDVNGKVPVEQMPTEAFVYKGEWDPNSGAYPPNGKKTGEFYRVSADGVFDDIEWFINDWCIWNVDKWEKSFNHQDVNSVNGQKGVVVLHGENIPMVEQTETSTDERSIKEYVDDITVDGETKDENGNYTSKVVVEVEDLPETLENRVYLKDGTEVYAKDVRLALDSEVVKSVNDIKPSDDGNVDTVVELTKAEYDALVQQGKDKTNVVYAVTDEMSSVDIINDFQEAENLTWSSSKIARAIEGATPVVFNDSTVSTTQGWTSNKIKNEIDAKSGIDDTKTATDSSWSSSKVNTEITTATTDMATQSWVTSTFEPKNTDLLTKTTADTLYQPTGDYATSDAISDMETKTHASQTYEPKNADLLTKTTADTLYEPKSAKTLATQEWVEGKGYVDKTTGDTYWQAKGSYLTASDISDMETKTHASQTYQPKGSYLTASDISDMETKTHASQTYEPKNTDLATKTWINEQGFSKGDIPENIITQDNFLTELKKYIVRSGDVITFNL